MKKMTMIGMLIAVLLSWTGVALADQAAEMQDELAMRASLVERYHKKASRSLVTAAQDEVFKNYFLTTGAAEKKPLKEQIDQISLAVQAKYKVDEMCLIDAKGQEISRIVYREVAPDKDLSNEEASAPFFKPSFEQDGKQVHVSETYMSADSLRWVICYATPIVLDDGSKPGIYHYEMALYSLQDTVNKRLNKEQSYLLLVNRDGYVMSDSRQKFKLEIQEKDQEKDEILLQDYFPGLSSGDYAALAGKVQLGSTGSDQFSDGGQEYMVAYRPLGYDDWTAVLVQQKK